MRRKPVVFGAVVLLVACGLWPVDCVPSWSTKPDNPFYVLENSDARFPWQYNSDGSTMQEIKWKVTPEGAASSILMGRQLKNQPIVISPSYTGRISRDGGAILTLKAVKVADNGKYECDVDFGGLDVLNHQTQLIVVVLPKITEQTGDLTINEGKGEILKCTASGNPKPTIAWYKDGAKLILDDPSKTDYIINNAQREDRGTYRCVATVVAGSLGSYTAEYSLVVTVRYKPRVDGPPQNRTVDEARDVTFSCNAVGIPVVASYQWFDKNNNVINDNAKYTITRSGQDSFLQIKNVGKDEAGAYACSGTNVLGEGNRAPRFLTVNYSPKEVTLTASPAGDKDIGDSVTFSCQSDGYPVPTYSWKFNGDLQNFKGSSVPFPKLDKNDAGNYTCIAKNNLGSKEKTIVLNVKYVPEETQFSTGTPNNEVIRGKKVTLTCSAKGYPPPTFTIKRNNVDVKADVRPGVHIIDNVQLGDDEASFSCTPRNEKGTGPEKNFKLVVLVAPEFVVEPASPETKVEKQNISYSCHAQGKPAPILTWQLNGKNLTSVAPYVITTTIVAQSDKTVISQGLLDIVGITWRQNGTYTCIATNSAGTGSRTTELTVEHRPVVKNQADHPKNKTVEAGDSVKFHCIAIGNPETLGYQWQFEGVNMTGATSNWHDVNRVTPANEGRYSCLGYNTLGWGPPADAYLFIKSPPKITSHTLTGKKVNETNNVTLVCRVSGVPTPVVTWTKIGSSNTLPVGEELTLSNVTESDKGTYRCTATNEKGSENKEIQLIVQVRPTITTSTPEATQVPDENGEAQMTCTVKGEPLPVLSWKRNDINTNELKHGDDRIVEIAYQSETSVLKVKVDQYGEKYYCLAENALGKDNQEYSIRRKGFPDKPIDVKVSGIVVPQATTVNVRVSWTPGYDGGYPQTFKVKYRERELNGPFTTSDASNTPIRTVFIVTGLKPQTEYEFRVEAQNERGGGEMSNSVYFKTPESAVPPPRATVSVKRTGDDTAVVTWKMNDNKVRFVDVQYREDAGTWKTAASDLDPAKEEYTVNGLDKDITYEFRLLLKEQKGSEGEAVHYRKKVLPLSPPPEPKSSALSQDAMIAIIAAVAGVLLIALVILALCCFRRRKKPYGGDQAVEMNQTESYPYQGYAAGGPADVNHGTNRRSYRMESVEDDPFIEAHSASQQSMAFSDTGKKKPNNVNYGYMSQDSFQPQPQEMLLNPGSRLSRNARLTQSTGELEGVGYPARGPQREFSTLPPYHDPPTFEEAMRQSARKPRTRKSTGDLVDGRATTDGSGRQSGRRARQSRPPDEPTDSSDAEPRYVRRATPAVRALESDDEPVYPSGHNRRAPPVPTVNGGPRQTPDPDVAYAKPVKKSKPRPPRVMRAEPAIGPPPQYTPEDRSLERDFDSSRHAPRPGEGARPMVTDLDLDDPTGPPELPPPLDMSDDELDTENNLPEPPPVFMRGERGPRSSRGSGYEPPDTRSSNRSSQPYINSQGQLVRPGSSRPDLRSSSHSLQRQPEPEVPSSQRQPQPESNGPEVNYVSYLV